MFDTGWFRECTPDAEDTRDGVRLVIKARPMAPIWGIEGLNVRELGINVGLKEWRPRTLG